jgi:hypothetical protein
MQTNTIRSSTLTLQVNTEQMVLVQLGERWTGLKFNNRQIKQYIFLKAITMLLYEYLNIHILVSECYILLDFTIFVIEM